MPRPGDDDHYDPQQPRVPKGFSGGGRWTDGDDQGEPSGQSSKAPPEPNGSSAEQFLDKESRAVVRSEYATPGTQQWDERHTVTLPDGMVFAFEQAGDLHRVYANGNLIEAHRWTGSGFVSEPVLQLALLDDRPPQTVIKNRWKAALAALSAWLARQGWDQGGKIVALSYDLESERRGNASPVPTSMTEDDVRNACKKYDDVRSIFETAEKNVRRLPKIWKPSEYGTAVHTEAAHLVNGTIVDPVTGKERFRMSEEAQDPNFIAETSILKILAADPSLTEKEAVRQRKSKYALGGTVRLDVLENVDGKNDLICVYDFKTGREGMGPRRFLEIRRALYENFPLAKQLVIIQMRPKPTANK